MYSQSIRRSYNEIDEQLLKELDILLPVAYNDKDDEEDIEEDGVFRTSFADSSMRYSIDNKKQTSTKYFQAAEKSNFEASNFVFFMLEGFAENSKAEEITRILYSLYDDIYVSKKLFTCKEIQNENFSTNLRGVFRNCLIDEMYTNINKVATKPPKKIKTTIINWFIINQQQQRTEEQPAVSSSSSPSTLRNKTVSKKRELLRKMYTSNIVYWRYKRKDCRIKTAN